MEACGAHHKPRGSAEPVLLQHCRREVDGRRTVVGAGRIAITPARQPDQQRSVAGAHIQDVDILSLRAQMKRSNVFGSGSSKLSCVVQPLDSMPLRARCQCPDAVVCLYEAIKLTPMVCSSWKSTSVRPGRHTGVGLLTSKAERHWNLDHAVYHTAHGAAQESLCCALHLSRTTTVCMWRTRFSPSPSRTRVSRKSSIVSMVSSPNLNAHRIAKVTFGPEHGL